MVSNMDAAVFHDRMKTNLIIMDFTKAFDKVPYTRQTYKLHYHGIRESTHQWIRSLLSERSQKDGIGWSNLEYNPGPSWCL